MRVLGLGLVTLVLGGLGACSQQAKDPAKEQVKAAASVPRVVEASGDLIGFDLNDYPGDDAMARMKKRFAYTGYWLTAPPGESTHTWVGKRALLRGMGYGFLVLANGRMERQIKTSKLAPGDLGIQDAMAAVAAAKAEGFPKKTILFLDQEEGGRLTDPQSAYLFGWTEAVASTGYRPGVYASGQAVSDGPGATITTIQDIRAHVAKDHLHPVAVWVYQDACAPKGPATGCTMVPPARGASGTPDVVAWQYAQSPRRPELTESCKQTYRPDGNCMAPGEPTMLIDMSVAGVADPSGGR